MSSIEERLAQDIAAVTRGVIMTDSDLLDARNSLDEHIDNKRPPRRRATIVAGVAAAAVVAVLGVVAFQTLGDDEETAPAPAEPAPTPSDSDADFLTGDTPTTELVHGVWRVDNGYVAIRFAEPGLVAIDDTGRLFHNPRLQGSYVIDGDLITVTVEGGPAGCEGQELAIRASVPGPGAMRLVSTGAGTGGCSPLRDGRWALEQVLPTNSPYLSEVGFSSEPGFEPVSDTSALVGMWLAEGGGFVLEIDPDGTYYVADDSAEPIDQGRWSLQGSDLTLTSSADSTECTEGDQWVWVGVEQVSPGDSRGMRGTVESNACGGVWASKAWILVPHQAG